VNGEVASLINRPDGEITARAAGAYIDITPQGDEPPRVTYTARDKSIGVWEFVSFKALSAVRPRAVMRSTGHRRSIARLGASSTPLAPLAARSTRASHCACATWASRATALARPW